MRPSLADLCIDPICHTTIGTNTTSRTGKTLHKFRRLHLNWFAFVGFDDEVVKNLILCIATVHRTTFTIIFIFMHTTERTGRPLQLKITQWLRFIVRTQPWALECSCLRLGSVSLPHTSCFLQMAWKPGTERVLQLNDYYRLVLLQDQFSYKNKSRSGTCSEFVQQTQRTQERLCCHHRIRKQSRSCVGSKVESAQTISCYLLFIENGCLADATPKKSMRTDLLPSFPSLDRSSQEAAVGFKPWIFPSVTTTRNEKKFCLMKVRALSLKILPCPRRVFAGSTVKNLLARPCSNRA
ncbi:hypothetical protein CSKR_102058 [Clonorchis sinensis]|uniref:Uncharacterized protein n=1 Tax=Clonorchis sinensis TaxID=79923 RepID=A0A3R7D8I7_CLOSI|nr:hypothetical protein CSKR_102058 [Clonorchis sinensis]